LICLSLSAFVFATDEIVVPYPSDCNVYAVIKQANGQSWNNTTNAFEDWSDANIGDYDIPLVDVGDDTYIGDFNGSIIAGDYFLKGYLRVGANPDATNDSWIAGPTVLSWNGSSEITEYALWVDVNDVKTKTDNLPADPADDSDIDTQLAAINTIITDANGNVTLIAADVCGLDGAAMRGTDDAALATPVDANFALILSTGSTGPWTTGSGSGGSAPTVEEIRTEMDNNSVDLNQLREDVNDLKATRGIPGGN